MTAYRLEVASVEERLRDGGGDGDVRDLRTNVPVLAVKAD
ncbi:hypothetical protein BH23ACT7_BH23ACT7_11560 [soil metagenome]|jgi:hypothetical protein